MLIFVEKICINVRQAERNLGWHECLAFCQECCVNFVVRVDSNLLYVVPIFALFYRLWTIDLHEKIVRCIL